MPCPFRLATEIRGHQQLPAQSTEEIVFLENGPFKARPMPNFSVPRSKPKRKTNTNSLTSPTPFQLSAAKNKSTPPSNDDLELSKQFHAKPMPNFSKGPKVQKRIIPEKKTVVEEVFETEFHARPMPDFHKHVPSIPITTSTRRRKTLEVRTDDSNSFTFKAKPIPSSLHKAPSQFIPSRRKLVEPQPFQLQTAKRESLNRRTTPKEDQSSSYSFTYKAKPVPKTTFQPPTPKQKKNTLPLTEPQPFQFSDRRRSSRPSKNTNRRQTTTNIQSKTTTTTQTKPFRFSYDGRQHTREKEKTEPNEFRPFKAKPVPKTTFQAPPPPSKTTHHRPPLLDPKGPNLRTDQQARARNQYNEAIKLKKEAQELRQKRLLAEQRNLEQAEVQRLRQLPVSQGGFIPQAKPILFSRMQRQRSWSASSSEMDEQTTQISNASSQGGDTASGLRSLISGFRKVKLRDSSSVVSSSYAHD